MSNAESNRVEYKRELNDKLERSVVAFLNTNEGGLLYIGVEDDGKPFGVPNIDLVQRQISGRIKDNISPSALGLYDVAVEKIDGVAVIKVIVSSGNEKPYYLRSQGRSEKGCFIRVGSSVQPMTTQMIDNLYSRHRPVSLGNIPTPRKELTFEQLEIYYQAKKLKLNDSFKTSLELLTPDGADSYVAYMLADENGVSIKVAKYAGANKVDLIENYEYGYCCLITATKKVLDRMEVENRTFAKITPKTRIEKQMVDSTALKEAVINAIVHNDYSRNAVPTVEIFSDRITITSYGGLPEGLSRESFFACCSMPRNRELMRVFRDVGLVEQLGSGMGRILNAYDRSVFEFKGNFLIVSFPFAEGFEAAINAKDNELGVNNGVKVGADEIILAIRSNPKITLKELAKVTSISRRTLDREIDELKASGKLKRVGSTRSGHWEVCE
ncbi:MAG: putative DNA binding domain-containing protein [Clostridiales Family XIII bacterium]|jgi:predicted HTH transcriptional regulator|nr:putative DNA binding domain-containing protein [Clostridiales Family XIII bacterium]